MRRNSLLLATILVLAPAVAFADQAKRFELFASSFIHEMDTQGVKYYLARSWLIDKKDLRAFECTANYNYADHRTPPAGDCSMFNVTLPPPLNGSNFDIAIKMQFSGTVEDEQKWWPHARVFKRPAMFWIASGDTGEVSFCDLGVSFDLQPQTCERMIFGGSGLIPTSRLVLDRLLFERAHAFSLD